MQPTEPVVLRETSKDDVLQLHPSTGSPSPALSDTSTRGPSHAPSPSAARALGRAAPDRGSAATPSTLPRLVLPGRRAPPGSAGEAGRGRYRSGPQNPVTDPQPRRPLGVSPPARHRLSLPGARQGPARPDPCLPRGRRGRSSPTPSAAYIAAAAAACVLRLGFVLEVTTVVASLDLQSVSHLLVLLQIGKEQERRRQVSQHVPRKGRLHSDLTDKQV